MDEACFELNLYLNSMRDRVIKAVAGDAGDTGINAWHHSKGLMFLGVFIPDERFWCHAYQQCEMVSAQTFIATMQQFFYWLGGDIIAGILVMEGAPAHSPNVA